MTSGTDPGQEWKPSRAQYVGVNFVYQYYQTLADHPRKLHKVYKAHSCFSRADEEGEFGTAVSAIGPTEIHKEIMSTVGSVEQDACSTDIKFVESQESSNGGLLVLVTGNVTFRVRPRTREFTQVFFLDKQTEPLEGYFVLNDMLRYLSDTSEAQKATEARSPQGLPAAPVASRGVAAEHAVEEEGPEASDDEEVDGEEVEEAMGEEEVDHEPQQDPSADAQDGGDTENYLDRSPPVDDCSATDQWPSIEEAEHPEPLDGDGGFPPLTAGTAVRGESSWAAVADKLSRGPGQLRPSKIVGYACPAGPAPSGVQPHRSGGRNGVHERDRHGGSAGSGASAGPTVLPPPGSSSTATSVSVDPNTVKLWLSHGAGDKREVLACVNTLLSEVGLSGCAIDMGRKDSTKEWGYLTVSSHEAAAALVQRTRDEPFILHGKPLKVQHQRQNFPSGQRHGGKGGHGEEGEPKGNEKGRWRRGKGGGTRKSNGPPSEHPPGNHAGGDVSAGR